MARYQAAICTSSPEALACQPGQWINYQGAIGRYMGRRKGVVWIAWGATARKRFPTFAAVFNRRWP